jgi:hypothetical protein
VVVRENIEAIEAVAEALKKFHSFDIGECADVVQAVEKGKDWRSVFRGRRSLDAR